MLADGVPNRLSNKLNSDPNCCELLLLDMGKSNAGGSLIFLGDALGLPIEFRLRESPTCELFPDVILSSMSMMESSTVDIDCGMKRSCFLASTGALSSFTSDFACTSICGTCSTMGNLSCGCIKDIS